MKSRGWIATACWLLVGTMRGDDAWVCEPQIAHATSPRIWLDRDAERLVSDTIKVGLSSLTTCTACKTYRDLGYKNGTIVAKILLEPTCSMEILRRLLYRRGLQAG